MMKKKKNSDVYDGETEVENYHTLCVLMSVMMITFMKIVKITKDNSSEQGSFVMEECAVPVGRRRKVHRYEPRRISHMN